MSVGAEAATLRVGGTQAPPTLGNPYSAVGPPASTSWIPMYDALTKLDTEGKLAPALALSWRNATPTTWEFKLRPNVKFHNGVAFNAQTVVDVVNILKSPESQKYLIAAELRGIVGVRAVDDLTVEFTTAEPDAVLPKRLNIVLMVEPAAWKSMGPDAFALKPIGTGPYRLVEWGRGNARIKYELVPDAWRATVDGKTSQITTVELLNIAETASRVQALLSNQIDISIAPGPEDAKLLTDAGFTVKSTQIGVVMSVAFRTERPDAAPLKDKRVRQALNYAVNRESMARDILGGIAAPASQGATAVTFGFNPDLKPYPYDPAKAKALLAEAGYADGFPLRIEVLTNLGNSDTALYQKMAADLGEVGVKVELRSSTFANWLRKYGTNEWGDIDAFSLTWNSAPFHDAIRPIEYFSCLKPAAFFCDPEVVPLIKQSNQAMDEATRLKLLQGIMARMLDNPPALYLVDFPNLIALSPRVKAFSSRVAGIEFENIKLAE
ncbi:MAG: ABC transporter substrate-binding protein [Rhodospirillaceae bacterium]|nr:ABC transporter substrate-binding protein [Rhodospirillaceae bacterium]